MQKAPHHSADLMHLPWQRFTRNTTYQEASGCFVYPKRPRTTHDDPCRQTALGLRCSSPPALVPSKQLACTKKGLRHLKHQPGQQAQIRTFLHHMFNRRQMALMQNLGVSCCILLQGSVLLHPKPWVWGDGEPLSAICSRSKLAAFATVLQQKRPASL